MRTSWGDRGIELDDWVMHGHPGVTFSFGLCREAGQRSYASSGYGTMSRKVFAGVEAHRLLLEYDDGRRARSRPFAHVPDDRIVVLGLVATNAAGAGPRRARGPVPTPRPRRPRTRPAISPKCGSATWTVGNALTFDDQRRSSRTSRAASASRRRNGPWGDHRPRPASTSRSCRCLPSTRFRASSSSARQHDHLRPVGRAHHRALRRRAGRRADRPGFESERSSSTWPGSPGRRRRDRVGDASGHLAEVLAERLGLRAPASGVMRCHDKLESRRTRPRRCPRPRRSSPRSTSTNHPPAPLRYFLPRAGRRGTSPGSADRWTGGRPRRSPGRGARPHRRGDGVRHRARGAELQMLVAEELLDGAP